MPPESQIKNFRGAFHFGTPSSFIQYLPVLILISFHFEKVYKKGKLPVLGNLPGMQEQSVPHYSP